MNTEAIQYKYKVSTTTQNSSVLGACEVCGNACSEVFIQTETRAYINHVSSTESHTHYGCFDYFGHEGCLKSKQR